MGETVYKAANANGGGNGRTLHRDPECRYAKQARRLLEKDAAAFPAWYPRCQHCYSGGGVE